MADSPTISPRYVRAAVDAARTVLREMEQDDVPASLRRVQASSARRLPPPLAARLVAELSSNAWFRQQVAEQRGDWDPAADDRDRRASALLVLQPDGWEAELAEVAAGMDDEQATADLAVLRRRLASVEKERDAARDKLKRLKRTIESERSAVARQLADRKAQRIQRPDPRLAEAANNLTLLKAENERLARELSDAEGRIERLKAELLKARRAKGELPEEELRSWGRRDSLDLARQLDALATAAMPDAALRPPPTSTEPPPELPAGVSPDSPAAIDWLLARTRPTTLIVDGYNVTWLDDAKAFAGADRRDQLLQRLGRLKRAARGPLRIIVVFDSQHGTVVPVHGEQVEMRFAVSADDEIRRLAATTEGDIVVVSTDREVREGVERSGVVGLWSQALVAWRP